jgi:hypothetical protein
VVRQAHFVKIQITTHLKDGKGVFQGQLPNGFQLAKFKKLLIVMIK